LYQFRIHLHHTPNPSFPITSSRGEKIEESNTIHSSLISSDHKRTSFLEAYHQTNLNSRFLAYLET
jgi:hypothetical protein